MSDDSGQKITEEKSYEIGQMIYVASNKKDEAIFPAIINEEINKKTREGNVVVYKVLIGGPDSYKVVDMSKVDGKVYENLEEVRRALIERATERIDSYINKAAYLAKKWYNQEVMEDLDEMSQNPDEKIDPSALLNEISRPKQNQYVQQQGPQYVQINGNRVAPMYGPPPDQYYQQMSPQQNYRNQLRNGMADPELYNREATVTLPDGTKVKATDR